MNRQSARSQQGEIEFRRKLVRQQVRGERIFDDELDAQAIEELLGSRMRKTLEQMTALREAGVALSPYLELGAERCQRALVMENDLGAAGAAVDLSHDMLRSCDHYREVFGKAKVPMRICADAYALPFATGSVPFAFCYETLHHFPDPAPIVAEVHRVLRPGGHFFFQEEPYKKILHLNLYKRKLYARRPAPPSRARKILDYFFSEPVCNEVAHGIVENEDLTADDWRRALSVFAERAVSLRSGKKTLVSELFDPRSRWRSLLNRLLGGEVFGTCRKAGRTTAPAGAVAELRICPSCQEGGRESPIVQEGPACACRRCGGRFPVVDGIAFLFPPAKLRAIYPGIVNLVDGRTA